MEKIIVAFEKEKNAVHIREMVEQSGMATAQVCHSGMEVRRTLSVEPVSTVVCGYKLSDGAAEALFEDLPPGTAMLMIAPQHQLDLCVTEDIFKLAAPVRREDLLNSVNMLLQLAHRMERFLPPQRGQYGAVERAKALLMARHGMTEAQAHHFLQKRSMDQGARLEETARLILQSETL